MTIVLNPLLSSNKIVKKRKFDDDEIRMIEEEFLRHKFKWAKISKKIPNTSPLMIKNFYYNNLRKKHSVNRILSNNTNDKLLSLATNPTISALANPHPDSQTKKSEKMSLSTILNNS